MTIPDETLDAWVADFVNRRLPARENPRRPAQAIELEMAIAEHPITRRRSPEELVRPSDAATKKPD